MAEVQMVIMLEHLGVPYSQVPKQTGFAGPTREEPQGSICIKGVRGYNSNFDLSPVRHKANEETKSLLLHNSTVIVVSYTWYCIGLLFCELLIGLPLCTEIWVVEKIKYVQH